MTTIPEFFKGRHVLVTGGTGFLGKILIEKLLRACPEVGTVYLLMRPKRGHEIARRLNDLVNLEIFDGLRSQRPGFTSHLKVVRGDVTLEGLGLSAEDRTLLTKDVSVVFHCAANVRFDQKLRVAIEFNTLGARRVLDLALDMTQLEALVHVSTAYCQCDQKEVKEQIYPAVADPEKVLSVLEWMRDDVLDIVESKLLNNLPNTYSYSKNLTEQLVASYSPRIPIGLARPSIVTHTWKEPLVGWVDNINGPTGLLIGAGRGVIRSMHCKADYHADVVPVDIVANAVLAMAKQVADTKPKTPLVINVVSGKDKRVTWGEVLNNGRRHLYNNPLSNTVWYPDGSIKSSKLVHLLCVIFFHFLPAYVIDILLTLCRKKPFMVNIQRRIQGGLSLLQYYTTKEWTFLNSEFHALRDSLSPEDRKLFYMDVREVDADSYILNSVLGTRKYFLKEDPSTIPQARKLLRRLYWLDRSVAAIFYGLLAWLLYSWTGNFISLVDVFFSKTANIFAPMVRVRAGSTEAIITTET
ncbi:putative fatty acyl-CoA reductase CG5065 [Anabrus simplex]|uniref:putative fatty acyl-CoA reductase CG5065 n=1 Tax=Anabrus simplex TaxID=316456 RepID=UPI0035A2C6BD